MATRADKQKARRLFLERVQDVSGHIEKRRRKARRAKKKEGT